MEENTNVPTGFTRQELGPRETLAFWVFAAIVILVVCIFYNLKPCSGASIEKWGQFGDSFGAINWFISLLSMCGVAYTAYIMKEQLDNQRNANNKQLEHLENQLQEQHMNSLILTDQNKYTALVNAALAELSQLPEAIVWSDGQLSIIYTGADPKKIRDGDRRAREIMKKRDELSREVEKLK